MDFSGMGSLTDLSRLKREIKTMGFEVELESTRDDTAGFITDSLVKEDHRNNEGDQLC